MSMEDTPPKIPTRRVQLLMPVALVDALDAWARRELTDRTDMIIRSCLAEMPGDLRQRVEETVTAEH